MAQKVTVQVVDDLDGSVITDGSGGTIAFAIEGKSYEIDLSADNTEKLYSALEPFVSKARSVGGAARRRPTTTAGASRDRLQEIREWAKANGHNVATRGRISREIQDAFNKAKG